MKQKIKPNGYLVFREARTPEEIAEIFALRHRVFAASRLCKIAQGKTNALGADPWDYQSRHFGLFHRTHNGEKLIGTERMHILFSGPNPLMTGLKKATASDSSADEHENHLGLHPILYAPPPNDTVLKQFVEAALQANQTVGESSRVTICPEYRSIQVCRFFVEAIIGAMVLSLGIDHGLTHVALEHKKFYLSLGFHQLEGTIDQYYEFAGLEGTCLHITPESISPKRRNRISEYAAQFAHKSEVEIGLPRLTN